MRLLILFIISILVSVYAFAQNQAIQQIVLTDGTVVKGQVEKQADGSFMVSTTSGDIIFFQPSEVNRIIGLNQAPAAESQSGNVDSTVKRKGNKLCFASSGIALTEENYYTPKAWEEYQLIVDKGKTGRILLYCGIGGFVLGQAGISLSSIFGDGIAPWIISGVIAASGLGVGISGLVMTVNSNKKLNKLADEYNQKEGVKLSFGVQQHGVGFALNF